MYKYNILQNKYFRIKSVYLGLCLNFGNWFVSDCLQLR